MTIHFKHLKKDPSFLAESFWLKSSSFIYKAYKIFLESNPALSDDEKENPFIEIRFKKRFIDKYDGSPNEDDKREVTIRGSNTIEVNSRIRVLNRVKVVKAWKKKPQVVVDVNPDLNVSDRAPAPVATKPSKDDNKFEVMSDEKFNQLKMLQPDLFEIGETFQEDTIAVQEDEFMDLPLRMVIIDDTKTRESGANISSLMVEMNKLKEKILIQTNTIERMNKSINRAKESIHEEIKNIDGKSKEQKIRVSKVLCDIEENQLKLGSDYASSNCHDCNILTKDFVRCNMIVGDFEKTNCFILKHLERIKTVIDCL